MYYACGRYMYMYVASFVWTHLWSDYVFWPSTLWNLPKWQCLSKSFLTINHCHPHSIEAMLGGWGGGSYVACLNFKTSRVGVYKCLSLIVGFAVTVAIIGRGRLSLAAISFYALSLLFELCPLSEFTLAGSLYNLQLLLVIHTWLVKP